MLSPHILAYCKMGYNAESIRPLKGAFNQSCPTLRLVSWVDSWEPGTIIRAIRHLDGDVLRIDEDAGTQAAKIPWAKAKDMHLHNLDRQTFQGSAACNINNPFNLEPFLHNFVRIKTGETINSDLDVVPTGMYGILADPRPLTEGQEALSIVFRPDGKAVGSITDTRLAHLFNRYQNAIQDVSMSFPEAVALLMSRYKEGRRVGSSEIRLKNYWTTPDCLMRTLQRGFRTQTERFASPLNAHTASKVYFSPYAEDKAFGAQQDAYSCQWRGSSQGKP